MLQAVLGVIGSGPPRLVRTAIGAVLAVAMLGACAMAAPPGDRNLNSVLTHVFAMRGCTQEDAPALEIYFTQAGYAGDGDPAAPFLRFEVASTPAEPLAPARLSLMPLKRDVQKTGRIARGQLVEAGHAPIWLSGTLSLTEVTPGKRAAGSYDVHAPDGRHLSGSFSAGYSNKPTMCG
jgi:hypothetical protein